MATITNTFSFADLVLAIQQTDAALLQQATKAVNKGLTLRNWLIGYRIAEYELHGADRANYGDRLLGELAVRLKDQSVSNTGRRQLYNYLRFYRSYPQIVRTASAQLSLGMDFTMVSGKVPTVSAQSSIRADSSGAMGIDPEKLLNQLSYSHFEQLLDMDAPLKRLFYEVETLRGNWSVRELKRQIATQYFERSGLSHDKETLALLAHQHTEVQSPAQIIRDPYVFKFLHLSVQDVMTERRLEDALLDKLQHFLLELGHGFCFEARQKRLLIGGEHCFVDLVFYHRILKCHVLIELKNDAFRHEHLGRLNTYVSYFKQQMTDGDQLPIGILLCTQKNNDMVQFALAGMNNNLFVSRYQLQLPGQDEMEEFLLKALQELNFNVNVNH